MKKYSLLLLALVCYITGLRAQQSPEQIIQAFFEDYQSLPPEEALENLYATMPWVESIRESVEDLKMQFGGLTSMVGSYKGHDLLASRDAVDRFAVFSYLVRYDRQPVRFLFQFYRPADEWGLYSFSYDDQLDVEMEDAVKIR